LCVGSGSAAQHVIRGGPNAGDSLRLESNASANNSIVFGQSGDNVFYDEATDRFSIGVASPSYKTRRRRHRSLHGRDTGALTVDSDVNTYSMGGRALAGLASDRAREVPRFYSGTVVFVGMASYLSHASGYLPGATRPCL